MMLLPREKAANPAKRWFEFDQKCSKGAAEGHPNKQTPLVGDPIAAPLLLRRLVDQQVPLCRSGPVWASWSAACAAASLAVSNRKGEQDT